MILEEIALNIRKDKNGIYYSKTESTISYPEDGNERYMQIEEDSFWFKHRNNIITSSVKTFSPKSLFFDIGGGNGFVAKRLQSEGVKTILVEPGKKGAVNAFNRGVENVLCSTLEDAEIIPNKIDAIGLFDVVEHIEDDRNFLKNICSYLNKDGHVYISVPAYNFLWSNEDVDAGHYRRYRKTQLENLLKSVGIQVEYSTYIFSILPLPVFLFRSLPIKLGLNKKSNNLEKHQNEHKSKKNIISSILKKIWNWEVKRVNNNAQIPFGGSCFIVGKKI